MSRSQHQGPYLDGDFGVLVRQFEGVVEDLEVVLESQRGGRQFLLLGFDEVVQPTRRVQEHDLLVVLQGERAALE